MFELKKFLGTEEANWEELVGVESIAKGDVVYSSSGYVAQGYASVTAALLMGVAMQTVDNSGGSAGDLTVQYQPSPLAIYDVGTADTMAQAYVGINAALASSLTITSNSAGTDITGVFKIMKFISTSKARGRLNFSTEADT